LGWSVKWQAGSHKTLTRAGWPNIAFAFHDGEEIGPRMPPGWRSTLAPSQKICKACCVHPNTQESRVPMSIDAMAMIAGKTEGMIKRVADKLTSRIIGMHCLADHTDTLSARHRCGDGDGRDDATPGGEGNLPAWAEATINRTF
jgi:hypothetical protein